MDGIGASLGDIDVNSILGSESTDGTQKSGRWAVQNPSPKDVTDHVDPVLRRMPRSEAG